MASYFVLQIDEKWECKQQIYIYIYILGAALVPLCPLSRFALAGSAPTDMYPHFAPPKIATLTFPGDADLYTYAARADK